MNFSLIGREGKSNKTYQQVVCDALSLFNIDMEYNGRNDLLVEDRKFSGNAVYNSNDVTCQHGTILISTDIDKMEYYLTPEISKLDRNHVASIRSRVINLSDVCKGMTISSMMRAMIDVTDASEYSDQMDMSKIMRLEEWYESTEWLFGGKQ